MRTVRDLARLEKLRAMPDMGPMEYAEAYSWIHFLRHGPTQIRDLLPAYLAQPHLRPQKNLAWQLAQRLGNVDEAWRRHMEFPLPMARR